MRKIAEVIVLNPVAWGVKKKLQMRGWTEGIVGYIGDWQKQLAFSC